THLCIVYCADASYAKMHVQVCTRICVIALINEALYVYAHMYICLLRYTWVHELDCAYISEHLHLRCTCSSRSVNSDVNDLCTKALAGVSTVTVPSSKCTYART